MRSMPILRVMRVALHCSRWRTFAAAVLVFGDGLLPAAQILATKLLIEQSISSGQNASLGPAIFLGTALGASFILQSARSYLMETLTMRVDAEIHRLFILAAEELTPADLEEPEVRNRVRAAQQPIEEHRIDTVIVSIFELTRAVVMAIGVLGILLSISLVAVSLMVLSVGPIYLGLRYKGRLEARLLETVAEDSRRAVYCEHLMLDPDIGAEIRVNDAGHFIRTESFRARQAFLGAAEKKEKQALLVALPGGVISIGMLILAILAVQRSVDSDSAANAAVVVGALSVLSALTGIGYLLGGILQNLPSVILGLDFLSAVQRNGPPVPTEVSSESAGPLVVSNCSFSYRANEGICDVSAQFEPGTITAIVGQNGSGKTTLIKTVLGVYMPSQGDVTHGSASLVSSGIADWQSRFGTVFQEFARPQLTVYEAVSWSRDSTEPLRVARVWNAIERAGLTGMVLELGGLDATIGREFATARGLSGGQWQRIALARLYYRGAAIWMLDEPTSSLDPEGEMAILKDMRANLGDRIGIVVSHRVWTARAADQILVMHDGSVVESGTFDALLARRSRFFSLFENQLVTSNSNID